MKEVFVIVGYTNIAGSILISNLKIFYTGQADPRKHATTPNLWSENLAAAKQYESYPTDSVIREVFNSNILLYQVEKYFIAGVPNKKKVKAE